MNNHLKTIKDIRETNDHIMWLLEQEDTSEEEAGTLLEHLYQNKERITKAKQAYMLSVQGGGFIDDKGNIIHTYEL